MKLDLSITPCTGHATGAVFQFAEGLWPGPIAGGAVISEEAFDFVEPLILLAWPHWKGDARYGVTEIGPEASAALIKELRKAGDEVARRATPPEWLGYCGRFRSTEVRREFEQKPSLYDEVAALFVGLAEWLQSASSRGSVLSLLGI